MNTELTKAAQQALELLKAHTESNYCNACDQEELDVIATLERALTQRPAAQTEREADGLPLIVAGAIFDFAGFITTRAEVIEVGSTAEAGPVADLVKEWAGLRGLDLADAAVLSWQLHINRASLPTPQQATPEPVGEVVEVVDLPRGYPVIGKLGDICSIRATDVRRGDILYTRPAPGVPEGFALLEGLAAKGGLHGVDLQYRRLGSCGWPKAWRATLISTPAIAESPRVGFGDTPQDALATAQAKGEQA